MPDKLIKIAIAGSTDNGKSTLLGRFLMDSENVPTEQLQFIEEESKRLGRPVPELAWLTDGLSTEQQHCITIDVAYRSINLNGRRYQLIDTPGHLEFLTKAACGISEADVLVMLIDISRSFTAQTLRHLLVARMFGIQQIWVLVNKMDLVGWNMSVFCDFVKTFSSQVARLLPNNVTYIPISALSGHNVVFDKGVTDWYKGPTLLQCFLNLTNGSINSQITAAEDTAARIFWYHPNLNSVVGLKILSGTLKMGDVLYLNSNKKPVEIKSLFYHGKEVAYAFVGQNVTAQINSEIFEKIYGICFKKPFELLHTALETEALFLDKSLTTDLEWITQAGNFKVHAEILSEVSLRDFGYNENNSNTSHVSFKRLLIHAHLPDCLPIDILNKGFLCYENKTLVAITGICTKKQ